LKIGKYDFKQGGAGVPVPPLTIKPPAGTPRQRKIVPELAFFFPWTNQRFLFDSFYHISD
jgi:hypothetical protein